MRNKKAWIIGMFTVDFFMVIFEIALLMIFLLGSSVVKELDNSAGGIKVAKEGEIGLKGIDTYMKEDYVKIIDNQVRASKGESLKEILGVVNYEG